MRTWAWRACAGMCRCARVHALAHEEGRSQFRKKQTRGEGEEVKDKMRGSGDGRWLRAVALPEKVRFLGTWCGGAVALLFQASMVVRQQSTQPGRNRQSTLGEGKGGRSVGGGVMALVSVWLVRKKQPRLPTIHARKRPKDLACARARMQLRVESNAGWRAGWLAWSVEAMRAGMCPTLHP